MRKIQLTQGQFALVDDEDFEYLNQYKWFAHRKSSKATYYAMRTVNKMNVRMHNVIAKMYNQKIEGVLDHKNRNGLDNRKINLRESTISQNMMNVRAFGASKYKGVSENRQRVFLKKTGLKIYSKWRARIQVNGKSILIGQFKTEIEAAIAYNEIAKKKFGEFANLNLV